MSADDNTSAATRTAKGRTAGLLSSGNHFFLPVGRQTRRDRPHGYHIDFRGKPLDPTWPPGHPTPWLHVDVIQAGLGSFERYVNGDGDQWLEGAANVGEFLVSHQADDGTWVHDVDYPHTFNVRAPWISAMAQGEGASLLARLAHALGDDRLREAGHRALAPFELDVGAGGVRRMLGGRPWLEEYPTEPGSFVLNGAIFAIWGLFDMALLDGDAALLQRFEDHVETIATELHRWDTGYWSRYDLLRHPLPNVASSFYHSLHINQLAALEACAAHPELARVRSRFENYATNSWHRRHAFAAKVAFRLTVPRSRRAPVAVVRRLLGR